MRIAAAPSRERRDRTGLPSAAPSKPAVRRVLALLALDSHRPVHDLMVGFTLGGAGVALNVAVYALAGWYHVQSVQLDLRPFLISGLVGFFLIALYEEFLLRGVVFRVIESGFGTIAALVVSSLAFGLLHLSNPGATLVGALGTAVAGGVMLGAAFLVTATCGWRLVSTGPPTSGKAPSSGCTPPAPHSATRSCEQR